MIIHSDYVSGKWTKEQREKAVKLLQDKVPGFKVIKKDKLKQLNRQSTRLVSERLLVRFQFSALNLGRIAQLGRALG